MHKVGRWYVTGGDGKRLTVSRSVVINGRRSSERMPIAEIRHLSANLNVAEIVKKLNQQQPAKRPNSPAIERFEKHLKLVMNSQNSAMERLGVFLKHTQWFGSLPVPKWSDLASEWGEYLISLPYKPDTVLRIIQIVNIFMQIEGFAPLHPLSKARIKALKAKVSPPVGTYIKAEHMVAILNAATPAMRAVIQLARSYGLRRSEVLALDHSCLRSGFLLVSKQRHSMTVLAVTKSYHSRRVPHWWITREKAFECIRMLPIMHPDTFSHEFDSLCQRLNYKYTTHDLRRSFITDSLDHYKLTDIMFAVGHKDARTTMSYMRDHREMDAEVWRPINA